MTDWNKAYGDMVRAGRKYLHVPGEDIDSFREWAHCRLASGAFKRVVHAYDSWPPKGVRIYIEEITI